MQSIREGLLDEAISLAYWMRGALSYEQVLNMTRFERQRVSHFIEKRLEMEKNKPPSQVY